MNTLMLFKEKVKISINKLYEDNINSNLDNYKINYDKLKEIAKSEASNFFKDLDLLNVVNSVKGFSEKEFFEFFNLDNFVFLRLIDINKFKNQLYNDKDILGYVTHTLMSCTLKSSLIINSELDLFVKENEISLLKNKNQADLFEVLLNFVNNMSKLSHIKYIYIGDKFVDLKYLRVDIYELHDFLLKNNVKSKIEKKENLYGELVTTIKTTNKNHKIYESIKKYIKV